MPAKPEKIVIFADRPTQLTVCSDRFIVSCDEQGKHIIVTLYPKSTRVKLVGLTAKCESLADAAAIAKQLGFKHRRVVVLKQQLSYATYHK